MMIENFKRRAEEFRLLPLFSWNTQHLVDAQHIQCLISENLDFLWVLVSSYG